MASTRIPVGVNRHNAPLAIPKNAQKEEPTDWIKIGAIGAAIIGGLLAAMAIACMMGYFPIELLGGSIGTGITLIVGAAILLPAAMVLFDKWQNPDNPAC